MIKRQGLTLAAILAGALFMLPATAQTMAGGRPPAALADQPVSRENLPWWQQRFQQTLAQAKTNPNAQIVWLGDSIVQNWQRSDILPVWNQYYAPAGALDFGFKGDTTSNLIWRLQNGQIAGLHPALIIILIGSNDLTWPHWPAPVIAGGVEKAVDMVEAQMPPTTHILLMGILPAIRSDWTAEQTTETNAALATQYANDARVTFVDVGGVLLGADGQPDRSLYKDPPGYPAARAVHPNPAGMARIAAALAPTVAKFVH